MLKAMIFFCTLQIRVSRAKHKVMRQLLPMTLIYPPVCLRSMVSNPDQNSDGICDLELTMDEEIKLYDLALPNKNGPSN